MIKCCLQRIGCSIKTQVISPLIRNSNYIVRNAASTTNQNMDTPQLNEGTSPVQMVPKEIFDETVRREVKRTEKYEIMNQELSITVATLKAEIVALRKDLEEREKTLIILKVRSRIEEIERKFLRTSQLKENRRIKWTLLLTSMDAQFTNNDEIVAFRKSISMSTEVFISNIILIYGDFSQAGAYHVNFPIDYTEASIQQMLVNLGMTPDRAKIETVKVILSPLPL